MVLIYDSSIFSPLYCEYGTPLPIIDGEKHNCFFLPYRVPEVWRCFRNESPRLLIWRSEGARFIVSSTYVFRSGFFRLYISHH